MPGIDGALSSITSDIDAAESDGTLIDVTIRDVKVRLFFEVEVEERKERGRATTFFFQKSTFRERLWRSSLLSFFAILVALDALR